MKTDERSHMRKKVIASCDDHWALKLHAASVGHQLQATQVRAMQRLVSAYESSPTELKRTAQEVGAVRSRFYWMVDPADWDQFVALRSASGLSTAELLHVAVQLETSQSN